LGELKMSGILGELIKRMNAVGLSMTPKVEQNELKLEFSEQEFQNAILKNMDERAKQSIKIELHEGKLVIKVRLW